MKRLHVNQENLRQVVSLADETLLSSTREHRKETAKAVFRKEVDRYVSHVQAEHAKLEATAANLVSGIQLVASDLDDMTILTPSELTNAKALAEQLLKDFQKLQQDMAYIFGFFKSVAESAGLQWQDPSFHATVHEKVKTISSDQLILMISDMTSLLQETDAIDETWIPPSEFERKTTKYWLADAHLDEVMGVTASITPLLVFGKKGLLSECFFKHEDEADLIWDKCSSKISSVYFDTHDMKFYNGRLRRAEGAQLLRVRWYGPKPARDKTVFLELKTHHEEWNQVNSVKQRVTILERSMRPFLSFTRWNRSQATSIVRAATPDMPLEELEHSVDVLLQMHELVVKHELRPCVRSVYSRVAFQSSQSNSLRVTIDKDVTLIDERQNKGGDWCISDDALKTSKQIVVPYSIFEVKLAGSEMPEKISNLIESGRVVEAHKFSKYLSGAAAFNKVKKLPYWANNPKFESLYASAPVSILKSPSHAEREPFVRRPVKIMFPDIDDSNTDCIFTNSNTTEEDPTSLSAGERGHSTKRGPVNLVRDRLSQLSRSRVLRSLRRRSSRRLQKVAPSRPARVEPKSFFANERTFIQWISIALLMATLDSLTPDDGLQEVFWLKSAVMICAGVMILYSVAVYYRRLSLMKRGKPNGYVDRFGPILLLVAVGLGFAILFIRRVGPKVRESKTTLPLESVSVFTLREDTDCIKHVHGQSPLEYEPSDVAVWNDALLVPSLSEVTAVSTVFDATAKTLITIPGTDIEAITIVGSRIFVVSEGKKKSDLIELAWNLSNDLMAEVGRWAIDVGSVESMAFVSGKNDGQLYVGDNHGQIYALDVPEEGNGESELLVKPLNHALFQRGLKEPKIAALQYLEGILYVLHDNAGIVRVWDTATGDLQSEWKLPIPPDSQGSANQIEGFFLERTSVRLRGSKKYLMHLAVDTPAQVWTLVVTVNEEDHSIVYPECAMGPPGETAET